MGKAVVSMLGVDSGATFAGRREQTQKMVAVPSTMVEGEEGEEG